MRGTALALAALAIAILALAGRADAFVYWSNSTGGPEGLGTIGRATLDGTGVNQGFIGASNPQGVAVDTAHVYWANSAGLGGGTIGQADIDGGNPNQSFIGTGNLPDFPGAFSPEEMAVDSAHIYWADSFLGQNNLQVGVIARANLDGSGVDDTFIVVQDAAPNGVAVDGAHVYWTGSNVIGRANLDGTGVDQAFIAGANEPWGVAVDPTDTHIYWVNTGSGSIGRADLPAGDNVDQDFIAGNFANVPEGIAVDGAHIYWANAEGPGGGTIGRANLDGTGVDQSFITGASSPVGVATDTLVGAPPPPTLPLLIAQVPQLGLPQGTERSLLAKLDAAQRKVDRSHHRGACGSLGAFINAVQQLSGHKLGTAEAGELIASAMSIRDSLGCG